MGKHILGVSFILIFIAILISVVNGKISNHKILYKKRRLNLMIAIFIMIPLIAVIIFIKYMPKSDYISTKEIPASYMIMNEDNYVASQSGSDCAGYATSYVLRHLGYSVEGASLYEQMPTFFGSVALHNIKQTLKEYNVSSQFYHGNIQTLKAELLNGVPVIVLITITIRGNKGLHYVAVVGYDEEHIYMADSTSPKSNIFNNKYCNRRVTYEEFDELWKTNKYPVNNLYVVVKN